jgi:hypothetical protein
MIVNCSINHNFKITNHNPNKKMEIQDINNSILIKQTQIRVESDPLKKIKLNDELKVLELKKEIENIKEKIKSISIR